MCAKTQMSDYNFSCIFFILLCMRRHNLIRAMCIESRHFGRSKNCAKHPKSSEFIMTRIVLIVTRILKNSSSEYTEM